MWGSWYEILLPSRINQKPKAYTHNNNTSSLPLNSLLIKLSTFVLSMFWSVFIICQTCIHKCVVLCCWQIYHAVIILNLQFPSPKILIHKHIPVAKYGDIMIGMTTTLKTVDNSFLSAPENRARNFQLFSYVFVLNCLMWYRFKFWCDLNYLTHLQIKTWLIQFYLQINYMNSTIQLPILFSYIQLSILLYT